MPCSNLDFVKTINGSNERRSTLTMVHNQILSFLTGILVIDNNQV